MLKINKYNLLVKLIFLFSITSLGTRLLIITSPNRVIGFFIFIILILITLPKLTKKGLFLFILIFANLIFSIIVSENKRKNFDDSIYWLITLLFLYNLSFKSFLEEIYIQIYKSISLLKFVVYIGNILLIIGFFDSRCYVSGWGSKYYIGYSVFPHSLASGVCLLIVLTMFLLKGENKNKLGVFLFIPGFISILESGARTFLLPLFIFVYIYFIYFIKSNITKLLLFPILIISVIYMFLNSEMMNKFSFTIGNQYIANNFIGQFTNGRVNFWKIDINSFQNFGLIEKMFGKGFDFVYSTNKRLYGSEIWAHNDLIDCLLSVGIVGLYIYIYIIGIMLYNISKFIKSKINILLLSFYFIFPLLINGLFLYQHYLYSFVLLCVFLFMIENKKK